MEVHFWFLGIKEGRFKRLNSGLIARQHFCTPCTWWHGYVQGDLFSWHEKGKWSEGNRSCRGTRSTSSKFRAQGCGSPPSAAGRGTCSCWRHLGPSENAPRGHWPGRPWCSGLSGCMDLPLKPGEPGGCRLCYQHHQQCVVLTLPLEGRAALNTAPLLSVWVAPSKAAKGWEEGGCPPLTTGQLPTWESRRGFVKDLSFWLPQHAESTKPRAAVNPFKQYLAR